MRQHTSKQIVLWYRHVLGIARYEARRLGLQGDDLEDCAIRFVLAMWKRGEADDLHNGGGAHPDTWLHHGAANWAKDCRRWQGRRCRRTVSLSEEVFRELPAEESVDARLMQQELRQILLAALTCLEPSHQDLFVRRVLFGERFTELAAAHHKTPEAMRKAFTRICAQLRSRLERLGWDEAKLREYLVTVGVFGLLHQIEEGFREAA